MIYNNLRKIESLCWSFDSSNLHKNSVISVSCSSNLFVDVIYVPNISFTVYFERFFFVLQFILKRIIAAFFRNS